MRQVYGVTSPSTRVPADVDVIEHGDLAAVTTTVDARHLRARRRDLLRHADVLQRVFEHGAVVPFRFGTVVDDVVRDLLEPRHDELTALLRELDGHAEMTVRAVFRETDVLRAVVQERPELTRLRETVLPVQLGEAIARALATRRSETADEIVETLGRHAAAVAVDDLRTELDAFRGAFLVSRKRLAAFDADVERIARAHSATTTFKVTGPLPPHHFVHVAEAA